MGQHGQHHIYVCQHGQHHTSLLGNTIIFSMGQHGQHHTSLWGNADNTILSMGQHRQHHFDTCVCQRRQHHTSLWGNAGNTTLMYGATPLILLCMATWVTPYYFMGANTTHCMKQYWQHYGYIHNSNMHRRHHAFMWQHM